MGNEQSVEKSCVEFSWRTFREDKFWRKIPGWTSVSAEDFGDHLWQDRNAIVDPKNLRSILSELIPSGLLPDIEEGLRRAPMSLRVSPYLVALIDWEFPFSDPIRRQFFPIASELEEDHPLLILDPGAEQTDSPVAGLTHRYPDRVLFLATDVCPVYCRYCTRSYAVGLDTNQTNKLSFNTNQRRWEAAFRYIEDMNEIEDVVISGGDAYRLPAKKILEIGFRLLDIPHVRRFRYATKGLAVQPMKVFSDVAWLDAVTSVSDRARAMHKMVSIHTHFNHPREITGFTAKALNTLFERGINVRNQSVLLRGVNDNPAILLELYRRLGYLNVNSYYQYVGDMVPGTEDLRTSLGEAIELEKMVRGAMAGYSMPTFVVDLPGGGGKRDVHSFENYNRETGLSVFVSPQIQNDKAFFYADPLRYVDHPIRSRWKDATQRCMMLEKAQNLRKDGRGGNSRALD